MLCSVRTTGEPIIMGYTQWILVQDSDLAFGFVPDRQYGGFHAGNLPLQQVRPGEVRTVEVVLYLENRFVSDVLRVDHLRFPVLANGVRDPAAMEWEMTLVAEILLAGSRTRAEPATRRLVAHQAAGSSRWIPTANETKAIADMISRRAKRPLLGGSPVRLSVSDLAKPPARYISVPPRRINETVHGRIAL